MTKRYTLYEVPSATTAYLQVDHLKKLRTHYTNDLTQALTKKEIVIPIGKSNSSNAAILAKSTTLFESDKPITAKDHPELLI